MGQQPQEYVMPKITRTKFSRLRQFARQLRDDNSGLALVEFAVSLPFFMGLTVGGIEVANYASVVMQLNQIAIHTADNAARIGIQSATTVKRINELQINDLFEGTLSEGDRVALSGVHGYQDPITGVRSIRGNAKIVLSSVETVVPFDPANPRYRIRWQRCAGVAQQYTSSYGNKNSTPTVDGFGPTGKKVKATTDSAIMLVELQYYYQPRIINGFSKQTNHTVRQTASMIVRDPRDYIGPTGGEGIYPSTGVVPATCT
jgi:hypothetical protein